MGILKERSEISIRLNGKVSMLELAEIEAMFAGEVNMGILVLFPRSTAI